MRFTNVRNNWFSIHRFSNSLLACLMASFELKMTMMSRQASFAISARSSAVFTTTFFGRILLDTALLTLQPMPSTDPLRGHWRKASIKIALSFESNEVAWGLTVSTSRENGTIESSNCEFLVSRVATYDWKWCWISICIQNCCRINCNTFWCLMCRHNFGLVLDLKNFVKVGWAECFRPISLL